MSNYYTGKCFLGLSNNLNHSHMVEQRKCPLPILVIKLVNQFIPSHLNDAGSDDFTHPKLYSVLLVCIILCCTFTRF
jgi:hypothetical protein